MRNSNYNTKKWRMRFRFLPLKEMKTRGAASGSLITGFPRAKVDSARRVWTVHRPSSCMVDQPPVPHKECCLKKKKKSLQGQKKNHVRREDALSTPWIQPATTALVYQFMWRVKSLAPKGPQSLRVLVTQMWRLHPRSRGASQNWWVWMKRSQAFRDVCTLPFGKKLCLFFRACACVTNWWKEKRFFYSAPRTQNTFLLHDIIGLCCSVIIGSSNARLHHVFALSREKKKIMLWLVQSKIKY